MKERGIGNYDELVDLALISAANACTTKNRETARELWRLALEYQQRAAALDNGKLPDIGSPPAWFKE